MNTKEWSQRWPNFYPEEVLSDTGMHLYRKGHVKIQPHAMDLLQGIRNHLDSPLIVNTAEHRLRGYRHFTENLTIRNYSLYSYHIEGLAFDISSRKYSPEEIEQVALQVGFSYTQIYSTWCHADVGVRME